MRSKPLCMAVRIVAAFVMATLVAQSTQAQTYKEKVLHTFQGTPDGANPYAGVIRDATGTLYGTTSEAGAYAGGAVFKLTKTGEEAVLYSFCPDGYPNCTDGFYPYAGLGVISEMLTGISMGPRSWAALPTRGRHTG
jgi:uncharacterized repeat protein (TIGR03803 family)